jgi:Mrp family chromosome partitioning ATPase
MPLTMVSRLFERRISTDAQARDAVRAPVIGWIPEIPSHRTPSARAMAVYLDPRGQATVAFNAMASRVPLSAKTILIVGTHAAGGTTLCATNVAIALAQRGRRVLLIGRDSGDGAPTTIFDLAATTPGATRGPCGQFCIQPSGIDRLDVLPWGAACDRNAACPTDVIEHVRDGYDHVIIDADEGAATASHADVAILVLRVRKASTRAARELAESIRARNIRVLGTILNGARTAATAPAPVPTPHVPLPPLLRPSRA